MELVHDRLQDYSVWALEFGMREQVEGEVALQLQGGVGVKAMLLALW